MPTCSSLNTGYYNVTRAVGPRGTAPNHRDDVLLVQYLLKGRLAENGVYLYMAGDWTTPRHRQVVPGGWLDGADYGHLDPVLPESLQQEAGQIRPR